MSDTKQLVGYFTQWGTYSVEDIDKNGQAAMLSAINYAFGKLTKDAKGIHAISEPKTVAHFNELARLKEKHKGLRVLISLGGDGNSRYFPEAAQEKFRKSFVSSCLDVFIKGDSQGIPSGVCDGVDIDWEWPVTNDDRANFTLLLKEFRKQLDEHGKDRYLLTAFLPAAQIKERVEGKQVFDSLDWATVQGYDLHGSWEKTTNFQSALYSDGPFSVNTTISTYLGMNAPPAKLVLGVPFYGRGWTGVDDGGKHGLLQNGTAANPPTKLYKDLKTLKELTRYEDNKAIAAWLFGNRTFWTIDDELVLTKKMEYVTNKHLGGAMAWSLDGDDAGSLIKVMRAGLRAGAAEPVAARSGTRA